MDTMEIVLAFLRWFHVVAGAIWIGMTYYAAYVLMPTMMAMEAGTLQKVVPAMVPNALRWFAASAGLNYLTGLLLLGLVFHRGGIVFEEGFAWGPLSGILVLLVFVIFIVYDRISQTQFGRDPIRLAVIGFLVIVAMLYGMIGPAGMTYRAVMIHLGAMFGTIMAGNGFMRIMPAQRRMVAALTGGTPPNPADGAMSAQRTRHNIYLSLPLLWTMLNQHTIIPGAMSPLWFVGVLAASWVFVAVVSRPRSA